MDGRSGPPPLKAAAATLLALPDLQLASILSTLSFVRAVALNFLIDFGALSNLFLVIPLWRAYNETMNTFSGCQRMLAGLAG